MSPKLATNQTETGYGPSQRNALPDEVRTPNLMKTKMTDTKFTNTGSTNQVPSMYELTEQFKSEANHLHPEAMSFAVMMGEHGKEIATNYPARKLPELMHFVAEMLEATLVHVPDDVLKTVNGMITVNLGDGDPVAYELPGQFKDKAQHLYPEVASFAVMMGETSHEIATNLPPRNLPEFMHHVADAMVEALNRGSDDELYENGVFSTNFAGNN
jgi:hypothetical protein